MRNRKPIIGITREVDKLKPFYSEFYLCCDFRYVRAVLRAGGVPLLIPIIFFKKRALYILKRINGLIIVGGADIPPRFYGEQKSNKVQSTYG